jgi:hypothetical protein
MIKRLLQEPLIHFTVFALLIFGAYALISPQRENAPDQILITAGKIDQLASLFAKTWQRKPTVGELKGLVDDYVMEEIYYREAKKLDLDIYDTVIRRRLRLKMEFLIDSAVDSLSPTDLELDNFLKANPLRFEIETKLAFQQVFLDPGKRGDKIGTEAAAILKLLRTNTLIDPTTLSDPSLLPSQLPLSAKSSIAQTFGAEFAGAIALTTPGQWVGPLESGYGLHIVRVTDRAMGGIPTLNEVRDVVAREWSNDRRKEMEESRLNALRKHYQVRIENQIEPAAAQ